MDRVKMAVIGLGRFGLLHARVLAQLPQVELVGICSRSEERARQVAGLCGDPAVHTAPDGLLEVPGLDAVDIVTEVDRHTGIALSAMERGKHVYSEILVTPSLEETDLLIECAGANDVLFMPGFLERFDARRAEVHRRLARGDLGRIVSVYGRRNIGRAVLDEPRFRPYPLILQPGIHTVDQLLWLTGERVTEVYARTRCMVDSSRADTWWAVLTFESGTIGVIEQCWFVPDSRLYWSDVHLEVVGTEGTAHIKEPHDASWIWTRESVESPDAFLVPEVHGRVSGALEAELAHFADCVAKKRPPLCDLQDARRALVVGLAIAESADTGRPVQLPAA